MNHPDGRLDSTALRVTRFLRYEHPTIISPSSHKKTLTRVNFRARHDVAQQMPRRNAACRSGARQEKWLRGRADERRHQGTGHDPLVGKISQRLEVEDRDLAALHANQAEILQSR